MFVADRDDLARLLDELLESREQHRDGFYAHRAKPFLWALLTEKRAP